MVKKNIPLTSVYKYEYIINLAYKTTAYSISINIHTIFSLSISANQSLTIRDIYTYFLSLSLIELKGVEKVILSIRKSMYIKPNVKQNFAPICL